MIVSMEPMEALRYLPYLAADGVVVTNSKNFVNIPDYPDAAAVEQELKALPKSVLLDIEDLAKQTKNPKGANMVLLGKVAAHLEILSADQLRNAVSRIFQRKGAEVVESNLKAFDLGLNA